MNLSALNMNLKKTIVVLGPHGMLGQMVVSWFSHKGYRVIPYEGRFEENSKWLFLNSLNEQEDVIVINCIGKIKQKSTNELDLIWSNSILPLALCEHLKRSVCLIHPSTDCVFDGLTDTPYATNSVPNALDSYGWSKRLGECALSNRPNTFILRVSIIGPDKNPEGKGLLAWFLSNKAGAHLNGFTNHLWNGITTLEWCQQVEKIIHNNIPARPCELIQLGTKEYFTKYQMLELFQKIYQTDFTIK